MLYLEYARRHHKLTQHELSKQTRIAQYHISDMETGKVWPTPDQRLRLATALDIPPELLMEPAPLPTKEATEVV